MPDEDRTSGLGAMRVPMKHFLSAVRLRHDFPGLSALERRAVPSDAGFLPGVRAVVAEIAARLTAARKRRRNRAELAIMDYAALRDIGFVSAPWSEDPAAGDQFARNMAWGSGKHLHTLLSDCSRARAAAQADIRQNRQARSVDFGPAGDRAARR